MAVIAELHDGRRLEFPDGTDPAVVQSTVKRILSQEGSPQSQATPNASERAPVSAIDRFMTGVADPIHGGAQLLTRALSDRVVKAGNDINNWIAAKTGLVAPIPTGGVDQMVRDREAAYQQARGPNAGVDWWRLAGNVVSPANLALGAAPVGAASTLGGRMALGAATGAASGLLSPVTEGDFATEKAKQAGVGALGGGVAPLIAAGVGRVVSPAASRNPDVGLLRSEGVKPTIGQTMGGMWNAAEEKLSSLPIMGDAIRWARRNAQEQLNTAAINRVGEPIGAKFSGAGAAAVDEAHNAASAAYDAAKAMLGNFQLDARAQGEIANLDQLAKALPGRERSVYNNVRSYLTNQLSPNGSLLADGFKRLDSKLGKEASRFSGSSDAYQQQLGTAFQELQRIIVDAGKRANPAAGEAFANADRAWANLVRVEDAAKRAINTGGVFTPGQLNMAVRATDRSVRDNATARGKALMQDLSSAGQNVLGNKVPDSGTVPRALFNIAALGGYAVNPMIPGGLLAGAGMYSPPIQGLLRAAVSSRPAQAEAVRNMLNYAAPMLAPAGGLLALDMAQ